MEVLVTGGTGFIGSHLVRRLVSLGHDITCLVRPSSNLQYLRNLPIRYRYDTKVINHYDIIYHLAGKMGTQKLPINTSSNPYWEANVELPKKLLGRCRDNAKFIYMSSTWVAIPPNPPTAYEYTKGVGEALVKVSSNNYSIVRPNFVYGPRDMKLLPLFKWMKRLNILFPIYGRKDILICPTYVTDVVDYLIRAISTNEKLIPISGNAVTVRTFIKELARALGVRGPIFPISLPIKREFFGRSRTLDSACHPTRVRLEEGLRDTVLWYKQNHYL